jgi:hypothetical protein
MLAGRRGCHGHDGGASSSSPIGKPPPLPRRLTLGLSCECLLGMHVDPLIAYAAPTSPAYFPELKK